MAAYQSSSDSSRSNHAQLQDAVRTIDSGDEPSAKPGGTSRASKARKRRGAPKISSSESAESDSPIFLGSVAAAPRRSTTTTSRNRAACSKMLADMYDSDDSDVHVLLDAPDGAPSRRSVRIADNRHEKFVVNYDFGSDVQVIGTSHTNRDNRSLNEGLANLRAEVLRKKEKVAGLGKLRQARDAAAAASGAPTGSKARFGPPNTSASGTGKANNSGSSAFVASPNVGAGVGNNSRRCTAKKQVVRVKNATNK